jgi:phosphate-selective porin
MRAEVPGISERAAKSVIEKITAAIHQMHRSVSEERKRLVIVQLCNAYASVGVTAGGNSKQYSFERAKFADVSPEFWEKFETLVGSATLAAKAEGS